MTAFQIFLILIGILLFVGSFFVSEKLSSSDMEEIQKLSEQEIKIIADKTLSKANAEIEDRLEATLDLKIEELERRVDKETNQKILSIGEYADTVLSSMNNSHDEIIFIYDMLNDKQEMLTQLTKDLQKMESELLQIGEAVEDKIEQVGKLLEDEAKLKAAIEEAKATAEAENTADSEASSKAGADSMEEALLQKEAKDGSRPEDVNNQILKLHEEGLSEVEIAKQLGRGLGEVKLVLGLFKEGNR